MAELAKLKLKRGQQRAALIRIRKFMDSLDVENLTQTTYLEVKARLEKLRIISNKFEEIQDEIELLLNGKEEEQDHRLEFEEIYYPLVAFIENLLQVASEAGSKSSIEENNSAEQPHFQNNRVKLPTIELPTFDDHYKDWITYRDIFKSIIHEQNHLSNIEKFHYLKASLKGEALLLVDAIQISGENYEIAFNTLTERYDNKKLPIHHHLKLIFDTPVICKESLKELRKLTDDIRGNVSILANLGIDTSSWDPWLLYLISTKLDNLTRREWEEYGADKAFPSLKDFYVFMNQRCQFLEKLKTELPNAERKIAVKANPRPPNSNSNIKPSMRTFVTARVPKLCSHCNMEHSLFSCAKFLELPVKTRYQRVKQLKVCLNCLKPNHISKVCVAGGCKKCGMKHNTLLHFENEKNTEKESNLNKGAEGQVKELPAITASSINNREVLLSTAQVGIVGRDNKNHIARVLLDCGSQSNFITREFFQRLGLTSRRTDQNITGIGQQGCSLSEMINLEIQSLVNNFSLRSNFLIIDNIVNKLPQSEIDVASLEIPEDIVLADPNFSSPGKIDMLLGASEFWTLLCIDQIKLNHKQPIIQKTRLGWIISGYIPHEQEESKNRKKCSFLSLDDQLEKFWLVEDIQQNSIKPYQSSFEKSFKKTIIRKCNGHFEIGLPLKENAVNLGNSFEQALRRFLQLEKRLSRSESMKSQYQEFMEEYENLGHMSLVSDDASSKTNLTYYLPHHGVFKETSLTTKLRVVFDGSAKTGTGLSLNDILMSGSVLQNDLFSILLRFRKHSIVIASDIEKMYRQIYISPEHRDLQRILWRSNIDEPIKKYRLNTVTYGTTSGSFLAIRCLFEIADRIEKEYPDIARIIRQDFYVDDLLTGGETVEEVLELQSLIASKMQEFGFPLRKWNSNHPAVIQTILSQSKNDIKYVVIDDSTIKTLGLFWDAKGDYLQYAVRHKFDNNPTKRSILAAVARIFDPLGLLSPVTILLKILLQDLWRTQVDWDESLPQHLFTRWNHYQSNWKRINEISVPRHVICSGAIPLQLHGFCDASQIAYGACVYLVSTDQTGQKFVKLLCGKSKVAPLKTITLPRLELCGVLLLSRLISKVVNSTDLQFHETYLWTDSQIALAWIAREPTHWKNFVANRVSEIQELTKHYVWRHVPTKDNPADLVSRGINAEDLNDASLWWNGPDWLTSSEIHWPNSKISIQENVPEQRENFVALVSVQENDLFNRYSSFQRLQRITAYLLRFVNNTRNGNKKRHGPIKAEELENALEIIVKQVQMEVYGDKIKNLRANKNVVKTSKLLRLNPMLDERGILRVGGRIQNSQLSFGEKHQIILPGSHKITRLLIKLEHHKHLHVGAHTLLNIIRQRFWIIGGLTTIKGILLKCVTCFRVRLRVYQHQMGQLPKDRVTPSHPFQNFGVDYAGPIEIKSGTLRNSKITKAYICIFICFSTKAVHIEIVSSLTSEAFLNALKRFIGRRGKPKNIYSDNGKNFVGAFNEIKRLELSSTISNFSANEGICWHFIPPRSPHFGGLWEAAVKSAKNHLKKVIGNTTLTFEELATFMTQVEACLNSRPLSPISDDPHDLQPLTPAHFLLIRPITGFPDEDFHPSHSRLRRYQHLVSIFKHFWNRWSKEYITSLQHRAKWRENSSQPKEGDLVLLVVESSSPLQWSLGRITKLSPGADGTIRVAEVKTATGTATRAIRKLCPLPQE